ncbi:MAG: DMT family transporter [Actinomycetota bacterium]
MDADRRTGWLLAVTGILLVSTDSLFIRLAEADGLTIGFLVSLASLPIFVVLWRLEARRRPAAGRVQARPIAVVGVLGAVSSLSFITAVTRTDVANVVAIVAAAPVMAGVLARFALGERVARRVWVAMAGTTAGIAVVVWGSLGRPTLMGDLLAVSAVAAFSAAIVVWRRHPDLSRYLGLAVSSGLVVAATAPFVLPLAASPRTYLAAGAMGLLFNPAGRIAHSTAPRFAPAAEVALFVPVETVAATLWAWLAFAEVPRSSTVIGAVIIVAGVLHGTVGGIRRQRRSRSDSPAPSG